MATNDTSTRHPSAKFGGLQFSYELESRFEDLTNLLGRVLDANVSDFPHPIGLVAGNIHQNARAILSLAPDSLVSEAYLIMRVMVDSTLNAIYLLGTTESERKAYASAPISEDTLHSGTAEELVHQAKTLNQLDQVPAHRLKSMNERIDSICSSGRTNPDTWRVIVASIFPQSNHLLAGSIDAYVFPFSKHPGGGTIGHGDEFTLLFLMGSNVIFELICALATHSDIGPLRSEAEKVHEEIMATMKSRNTGIEDPAQGARDQLDRIEHFGSRKLLSQLVEFKTAFIFSYEAALIAPTLRKENDRGKFKLAALYFRRSLNDLRSVWLLLQRGYTAQAAACAGSLFETCLAAICLLDIKNVQAFQAKLQTATGNDFPWGPMEMAKMSCASGYDLLISP